MATMTSRLIVSLIDGVSAPARAAARGILGISQATRRANGTPITFQERLGEAISRNNAALDRARGRMVDAVAGFYALRAAIGGPIAAASAFEDAMADVRKVVDFPTPASFEQFKQGLIEISKTVPMTVDGLAQIAAAAGQAGIAREDILKFTDAAAKIGTAFDISADQAGDAMAKLMTGLSLTLDEAILLTDAMNHLSNAQASSAPEILDVVRRVGAQAKMYGFTAEQTAAFASAMISAGAESEVAATSFRNMGKALTIGEAATARQADAFRELGLDAKQVAKDMQTDAVGTTIKVLEALSKIPAEQRAAISSQLFGDEARALGPLLTNLELVRSSVALIGDQSAYAGSSFREFEARSKTFSAAVMRFRNRLQAVAIVVGSALIPIFTDLMERLSPFIEWVSDFIAKHPQLVGGIVATAGALVGLRIALSALSYLTLAGRGGVLGALAIGGKALGGTVGYLWGAAKASIALQGALAAMSGAQGLTFLQKFATGLRGIALAVPGIGALSSALSAIGAALATISAPVWATFAAIAAAVAAAGVTIWKYWDRITAIFRGVGRAIGEILSPAFEAIRPVLDWFAPLGDLIAAGWQKAKDVLTAVGEWFASFFQREVLSEEEKAQYEQAGYDAIMALWDGMKQVMADLVAWVKEKALALVQPFKDMKDWFTSTFSGEATGVTSDPMGTGFDGARASGGPITAGRTYLVGEQGPELVTPSKGGYVHPTGTGIGSGGGAGVTQNLSVTINTGAGRADAEDIVRRVVDAVSRETRALFNGVYADAGVRVY